MSKLINKTSGRRSILESVVIVVSILLAFAIEAWWAENLESITENKELVRLHTEFIENRDRIDRSIASQEIARNATNDLYRIIADSPASDEPVAVTNGLLQAMLFATTFDVATPILDSLVLSGNLSVIEDTEVLATISSWQRSLAQVNEAEGSAQTFTNTQLFPRLVERGNIAPLLIPVGRGGGTRERNATEQTTTTGLIVEQINDGPDPSADTDHKPRPTLDTENRADGELRPNRATRFSDSRQTLIRVDGELKSVIAQRIREAGRSAQTLTELKESANQLIAAIENAQDE